MKRWARTLNGICALLQGTWTWSSIFHRSQTTQQSNTAPSRIQLTTDIGLKSLPCDEMKTCNVQFNLAKVSSF